MASIEYTSTGIKMIVELPPDTETVVILPMNSDAALLAPQHYRMPAPPQPEVQTAEDLNDVTMVVIAGTPFVVNGVNRDRGTGELIIYTEGGANRWGTDLIVAGGRVTAILARERDGGPLTPPAVPSDGYVISAHGETGQRLLLAAHDGDLVELRRDKAPTSGSIAVVGTGPLIATYMRCWPTDPLRTSILPAAANGLHLGFLRNPDGGEPKMVGYTSAGLDGLKSALTALRQRGVEIAVEIGGQGGGVSFANPKRFLEGVIARHQELGGFDLLGLDMETGHVEIDKVLDFDTMLAEQLPAVRWTAAPNGSWINDQLPLIAELYRRGRLRAMGQQFYEGPKLITESDVAWRLEQALRAGVGPEALGIGVMVGPHPKYWTVPDIASIFGLMHARFGIRNAYAWDIVRNGTAQALQAIRDQLPVAP